MSTSDDDVFEDSFHQTELFIYLFMKFNIICILGILNFVIECINRVFAIVKRDRGHSMGGWAAGSGWVDSWIDE